MLDDMIKAVRGAKCVAAMTGAGVSTLCGIPDFRGPKGLYKNPDAERIFDIDWFDRDPSVYFCLLSRVQRARLRTWRV